MHPPKFIKLVPATGGNMPVILNTAYIVSVMPAPARGESEVQVHGVSLPLRVKESPDTVLSLIEG